MAGKLMSELGDGQGIKAQDLKAALQEAGADLSSKEGLRKALETVTGSEAGQGSRGDQTGDQTR
jgi:hypothetical protein